MNLAEFLKGQRTTRNIDAIQPNVATVGHVLHSIGHEARFVHIETGFTDAAMQTGLVGYSIENPVFIHKTPAPIVIQSTPQVRQSNAPIKRGGCK